MRTVTSEHSRGAALLGAAAVASIGIGILLGLRSWRNAPPQKKIRPAIGSGRQGCDPALQKKERRLQELHQLVMRLVQRRAEVFAAEQRAQTHALSDLSHEATGELSHIRLHSADEGSDAAEKSLELTITTLEAEELFRIDAALRRAKEGRYGVCERCGEEVALDRLAAIPETSYCVDCAEITQNNRPVLSEESDVFDAEKLTAGEEDLRDEKARGRAIATSLQELGGETIHLP